jgi:hypothetical protein
MEKGAFANGSRGCIMKVFGNIKMIECVGWGNDSDGHIEIINVIDMESGKHINPMEWAKNYVWRYVEGSFANCNYDFSAWW